MAARSKLDHAGATVGDMLDVAGEFEERLVAAYADLRDHAESDGVRLLTHYLARHRSHLPTALMSIDVRKLKKIRETILSTGQPPANPVDKFAVSPFRSDIGGDECLDVAIDLVEALAEFYRWLTMQPVGPAPHELFCGLLETEQDHLAELQKLRSMDYF